MPEREVRFPHFDEPLRIMVIYESDYLERNDAIKTIRQDLLRRQMDVTMWGYVERKPRDYVLTDLQAEHYDLLIDLTTRPLLPLRYLALYTDADFKVGMNLGEGIHDMLISLPDLSPEQGEEAEIEASWLYHQMLQYLTTIKSKD